MDMLNIALITDQIVIVLLIIFNLYLRTFLASIYEERRYPEILFILSYQDTISDFHVKLGLGVLVMIMRQILLIDL